jgi:hypothetical protein
MPPPAAIATWRRWAAVGLNDGLAMMGFLLKNEAIDGLERGRGRKKSPE